MKKLSVLFLAPALILLGCSQMEPESNPYAPDQKAFESDEITYDQQSTEGMTQELSLLMDAYYSDEESRDLSHSRREAFMEGFNNRYGTEISLDAEGRGGLINKWGGGGGYGPADMDVPFETDGAVYVCGGADNPIAWGVAFMTPKYSRGGYYHAAILDKDLYDPADEEARCLQTALMKGADYQSAYEWRTMCNMAVMEPVEVDAAALNEAQKWMHKFAKAENTDVKYGFFENTVNISKVIDKRDVETFYCTKVCWQVYDQMGIDIDSDTKKIDPTKADCWPMIRGFYRARYFWNRNKADQKALEYMWEMMESFVIADEMYTSEHLTKKYENIHEPVTEDGFVR